MTVYLDKLTEERICGVGEICLVQGNNGGYKSFISTVSICTSGLGGGPQLHEDYLWVGGLNGGEMHAVLDQGAEGIQGPPTLHILGHMRERNTLVF